MPDLQALARGYRILGMNGIGLGLLAHLTLREPGGQTFWSYQFGESVEEVTPDSLREVDFDLQVLSGGGAVNRNLRIHSEIYAARPDVTCIVHHHGGDAIALGAIGANVFPYDRNAARWHGAIDLVDDNESPVLAQQGASIAAALGGRKALLLKHHGVLVTGPNLQDVVVATIELERVCGVQLRAMAAGSLHRIPDAEIEDAKATLGSQRIADGYWDYYCRRLARVGLDIDR
jgi:L-fuculose-phosphate aldolase